MLVTILTHLLRRQIICWFEHVLYIDDDEEGGAGGTGGTRNLDGQDNLAGGQQQN